MGDKYVNKIVQSRKVDDATPDFIIGHSYEIGTESVGLCFPFQDPQDANHTEECAIQAQYNGRFPDNRELISGSEPHYRTFVYVDKFASGNKVVFIGACATDVAFRQMWEIDTTTRKQALIVPDVSSRSSVNLLHAAQVWQTIAFVLSEGKTVQQAVEEGNRTASTLGYAERWIWIGDGGTRIAAPPR